LKSRTLTVAFVEEVARVSVAIDFSHLDLYVQGDRDLLDEILVIFEEQAEILKSALDPAASDDEWRNAAHKLKGASRGVGAFALGEVAEAAEALIGPHARMKEARRALLPILHDRIDAAVDHARLMRDGKL
jgi:HPt (histidine-containing phosphotransfer) domain-containing protein